MFTPSASFVPAQAWPDMDHLAMHAVHKSFEYSTPQKMTTTKLVDEATDQEFEIQTFKVENCMNAAARV